MKISEFTQAELDEFREECNFTDIESQCFELKARNETDVAIAFELNISSSTVAVTMRRVRAKIDAVLRRNVRRSPYLQNNNVCNGCKPPISHKMSEWARMSDMMSIKGQEYIYEDYRTETTANGEINIPRVKMGDGIHYVSELPFYTSCITEEDIERWDNKPDTTSNDFGKIVVIDHKYAGENKFVFPTKGYVTLEFKANGLEHAEVRIYGASGKIYFTLLKYTEHDNQSKEIMVERGMMCEYVSASESAEIKFYPLV